LTSLHAGWFHFQNIINKRWGRTLVPTVHSVLSVIPLRNSTVQMVSAVVISISGKIDHWRLHSTWRYILTGVMYRSSSNNNKQFPFFLSSIDVQSESESNKSYTEARRDILYTGVYEYIKLTVPFNITRHGCWATRRSIQNLFFKNKVDN